MISAVPNESIDLVWNTLLPQIEKALSCGMGDGETKESLLEGVKDGSMFMIVAHEGDDIYAGGVLSVQEHPNKKTLFVELLAGKDLDKWIEESDDTLKRIKDEIKADCIEASCRPGLTKRLKNWKTKATIMELR